MSLADHRAEDWVLAVVIESTRVCLSGEVFVEADVDLHFAIHNICGVDGDLVDFLLVLVEKLAPEVVVGLAHSPIAAIRTGDELALKSVGDMRAEASMVAVHILLDSVL